MIHHCRGCGAPLTTTFANLGRSPLSNEFKTRDELDLAESTYPLHVFVCNKCQLVQLPEHVYPGKIFNDRYAYFSSVSESWVRHAKMFAEEAIGRFNLNEHSFVIEVGSNDGYLLQHFKDTVPVLGIEPSENVANAAIARGVPTRITFLNPMTARMIMTDYPQADLIYACNVLAHTPDVNGFVLACAEMLRPEGTIVFEFPWLLNLMRETQLDTIYHEHYSYLSLHALGPILRKYGLHMYDVERVATHGGSLRVYVCFQKASHLSTEALWDTMMEEQDQGLHKIERYAAFDRQCVAVKTDLLQFLINAKQMGANVVGYGAPAKATTLLNYAGVGPELLQYIVEDAPAKIGKFVPGVQIPILNSRFLVSGVKKPSHVLVLPWNLIGELSGKIHALLPDAKIVTAIPSLHYWP